MKEHNQQNLIIFATVADKVCNSLYRANVGAHDTHVTKILNEYLQQDLPAPELNWIENPPDETINWIKNRFKNEFQFCVTPPEWIHKPSWIFTKEGNPMKFVAQFKEPKNEISKDGIVYVFSGLEEGVLHNFKSLYLTYRLIKQEFSSDSIILINSHLK
jgi:hypothetical protein